MEDQEMQCSGDSLTNSRLADLAVDEIGAHKSNGISSKVNDGSSEEAKRFSGRKRHHPTSNREGFPEHIRALRLEAIFHPKFENESSDRQIRQQILSKVASGSGYLEASLKHSGSLMLWSGGQRYYSKNSVDNRFTIVGEIMLRRHFARIAFQDSNKDWYERCSDFVETHRLTLAFEVVTSFLGDHGQRPKRDFLILTAVADKRNERFFSTNEIIKFAQEFRLPWNDCWIFSGPEKASSLFSFYDATWENGYSSSVVKGLTDIANYHVASMYPHGIFQGEILEGIVVRFVPFGGGNQSEVMSEMKHLAAAASDILAAIPPDLEDCTALYESSESSLLSTDLRAIARECFDSDPRSDKFETILRPVLASTESRSVYEQLEGKQRVDLPSLVRRMSNVEDSETGRIANLIEAVADLNIKASFVIHREVTASDQRWICIVHVLHDSAFRKFNSSSSPEDMNLFRGFSIEVVDMEDPKSNLTPPDSGNDQTKLNNMPQESLMLKMKFLPYMVRTFACRNHLRTLQQGGAGAFERETSNLLSRWSASQESRNKWQRFFKGWSAYAQDWFSVRPTGGDRDLPLLSESRYLDHLETFTELFHSGRFKLNTPKTPFSGLAVVVSPDFSLSQECARVIGSKLGDARYVEDISNITIGFMGDLCQPGHGAVCPVRFEQGKALRRLTGIFSENIGIIYVSCSSEELRLSEPSGEAGEKRLAGLLTSFRNKCRCAYSVDIPRPKPVKDDAMDVCDSDSVISDNERTLVPVVEKLLDMSRQKEMDQRLGMLVFFPGIPGCGKSTLASDRALELIRTELVKQGPKSPRALVTFCGDKTKGKFWPMVERERASKRASISIVDKNTPANTWSSIARICAHTKSMGCPVIPDSFALSTTEVAGMRKPDGTLVYGRKHHYPFSLNYYAICLSRVLNRPPHSHVGRLDQGQTEWCCMIVASFMGFYRGLSAEDFVETLRATFCDSGGIMCDPITVPFVADDAPQLPAELHLLLEESLQAQLGLDVSRAEKKGDYLNDLEKRLRLTVPKYTREISSMASNLTDSTMEFTRHLLQRIEKLNSFSTQDIAIEVPKVQVPFIKLVSIDVDVDKVHALLRHLNRDNRFRPILDMIECADFTGGERFVKNTHVTLVHFQESSQAQIRSAYGELEGATVEIVATGIYWSNRIAAISVRLPDSTQDDKLSLPQRDEAFPHVTICYLEGVSAVESNELPSLLEIGEANFIEFDPPEQLAGTIAFWEREKSSK